MTDKDSTGTDAEIAAMSFEDAMRALEGVVAQLERGDVPLEQSIGLYERGAALRAHCDGKLKAAEEKVARIALGPEGQPTGLTMVDPQ